MVTAILVEATPEVVILQEVLLVVAVAVDQVLAHHMEPSRLEAVVVLAVVVPAVVQEADFPMVEQEIRIHITPRHLP